MITHANLADNLNLIVTGLSAVDDTVVVGWLPVVRHNYMCTTLIRNISHSSWTPQSLSRIWNKSVPRLLSVRMML